MIMSTIMAARSADAVRAMADDFLLRAALAGAGLALAAGPLGSFVVWRRMAYFGDAVAHGAVLGVALALAFSLPLALGMLAVTLGIGLAASALERRGGAMDSTLGVLSHSALALGLVVIPLAGGRQVDLDALLFGDILAVTQRQLWLIWGGALAVLAVLLRRWSGLLMSTLSEELAAASGIVPGRERLILTLMLAVVVALGVKVVGALLIGALLILPAAAARNLAGTPESMALLATGLGALATLLGVWGSALADSPTGPSIVVAAALLFLSSLVAGRLIR